MLTPKKQQLLLDRLKAYQKRFLSGSIPDDLDESGTRIMINHFLTDVLGYTALEEVRTEYMIKGTYADYMVQLEGKRYFLVEVKAFSINLNEGHLRQAVNYGANEGVEWAVLTNGRQVDCYRILFEKPIRHQQVFSINLSQAQGLKAATEFLQYLTRDGIIRGSLEYLWNKSLALTPASMAKILLCSDMISLVRKRVNNSFETRFTDEQIQHAVYRIITEKLDLQDFRMPRLTKKEKPVRRMQSQGSEIVSESSVITIRPE